MRTKMLVGTVPTLLWRRFPGDIIAQRLLNVTLLGKENEISLSTLLSHNQLFIAEPHGGIHMCAS